MTALAIVAVVLAGGWVFARLWLPTRYIVLKEVGHPQYFTAGVAAVYLFTLGACVHHFTHVDFPTFARVEKHFVQLIPEADNTESLVGLAECAGWSVVLAFCLPLLYNIPLGNNKSLQDAVLRKVGAHDTLDTISAHSLSHTMPLAFTLESGKVYVGYPVATSPLPELDRKWVRVFPLLSGYRDEKSRLILSTNYTQTYDEIKKEKPERSVLLIGEFFVVLSISQLVSIQAFDIESYATWFPERGDDSGDDSVTQGPGAESDSTDEDPWSEVETRNPDAWKLALAPPKSFDEDEKFRMGMYFFFYVGITLTILLLAYDVRWALGVLFLASLFGMASCSNSQEREQAD